MKPQKPGIHQLFKGLSPRAFSLLLAFSFPLLLSGCPLSGGHPGESVKEPPYIPIPPAVTEAEKNRAANEFTRGYRAGTYNDLLDVETANRINPQLMPAVSQAIHLGILRPANILEKFNPERSVSYGEFRDWLTRYQQLLAAASASTTITPGGILQTPPAEAPAQDALPKVPQLSKTAQPISSIDASIPRIPPSTMTLGGHTLSSGVFLTREDAAGLYLYLTRQEPRASAMSEQSIRSFAPSDGDADVGETFEQFKDFGSISLGALRAVGFAYRDKMLQGVFQLFPNRLIIETGMQPQSAFTRGDAIVFLYWLYGQAASTIVPKDLPPELPALSVSAPAQTQPPLTPASKPTTTPILPPAPEATLGNEVVEPPVSVPMTPPIHMMNRNPNVAARITRTPIVPAIHSNIPMSPHKPASTPSHLPENAVLLPEPPGKGATLPAPTVLTTPVSPSASLPTAASKPAPLKLPEGGKLNVLSMPTIPDLKLGSPATPSLKLGKPVGTLTMPTTPTMTSPKEPDAPKPPSTPSPTKSDSPPSKP